MNREIQTIRSDDLPAVSAFLHRHWNSKLSEAERLQALTPGWPPVEDVVGQMLMVDGKIGGVIGQLFGCRRFGDQLRTTCNLTSWVVLPELHGQGLQLLSSALKDEEVVYTNHSLVESMIPAFKLYGFQLIDATEWIVVNLPRWSVRSSLSVEAISERLTGEAKENFEAHAGLPTLGHVGLEGPDGTFCHVTFVRGRWHKIPLARIIYASDYDLLERLLPAFSHVVMTRFGLLLTAIEKRRCSVRPSQALTLLHLYNDILTNQRDGMCLPRQWQTAGNCGTQSLRPRNDADLFADLSIGVARIPKG